MGKTRAAAALNPKELVVPLLIAAALTTWAATLAALAITIRTIDCCNTHAEASA